MKLKEVVEKYSSPEEFIKAVNRELIALAEENPDFVYAPEVIPKSDFYNRCSYNSGAKIINKKDESVTHVKYETECTGCIFGQALQRMGWDNKSELGSEEGIIGLIHTQTYLSLRKDYTKTANLWADIQGLQDTLGRSWKSIIDEVKDKPEFIV